MKMCEQILKNIAEEFRTDSKNRLRKKLKKPFRELLKSKPRMKFKEAI